MRKCFLLEAISTGLCMDLPERLRQLRERAGLTQSQLAKRLGKHQTWVSRRELATSNVLPNDALDWAEACGFSGALVFVPQGARADRIIDLLQSADPELFTPVADLLEALPSMDPRRRGMLLAMLATALQEPV